MENLPFQNYDFAFANGICAVVGIVRPQTTPTRLLSGTFRLLDMTATISFTVTKQVRRAEEDYPLACLEASL